MAIKAQVPIVPVAVQGGRAAMRKGSWIIQPVVVDIRVGPLIETRGWRLDERDQLIGKVRRAMEELLSPSPELQMTR
jgi:1-acyl-sn-glycerol-3-phosphate acyltransferase